MSNTPLKPSLGLPSLTFYGVGVILGAGVYSIIGAAAGSAGNALWLSFVISAIVVLLTALSYAELSTLFPKTGAEYVYLKEAFPTQRWLAFTTALLVTFSGAATAATVSIAFVGYLKNFVDLPAFLTVFSLLAFLSGINILGIRESSWVNILFTLIEAAGLLLLIWVGMKQPSFGEPISHVSLEPGIFVGAALVFFSYLGFENIANLAEEAKNPARDLPIAILTSLVITTILYVLVGLSVVALLSPEKLAQSASPLSSALAQGSPSSARILGVVALFATANTALISLLGTSRILFSIARNGDLPRLLNSTLRSRKTPWAASLVVFAVAISLLPLGKVEIVASLSSFTSLLAFCTVNVAVIVLRFRKPSLKRPFRVPLTLGKLPILPVTGLAFTFGLLTQFQKDVYVLGIAAILLILLFYWIRAKK